MERANMEQAMRNYYGLGFAEPMRHEVVRSLTAAARAKTYARYRKSEQALIRLKEVRIDIARRQVRQIEAMINDLDSVVATLESEIEAEENRVGIRDPRHIRYSTLATATIVRRDNLKRTVSGLKDELAVATIPLAEVSQKGQE
jgi:hypothetical protein